MFDAGPLDPIDQQLKKKERKKEKPSLTVALLFEIL